MILCHRNFTNVSRKERMFIEDLGLFKLGFVHKPNKSLRINQTKFLVIFVDYQIQITIL